MRNSALLLLGLLAACGTPASSKPDAGSPTGSDAGAQGGGTCSMGEPIVHLSGFQAEFLLGALASAPGKLAVSYAFNHSHTQIFRLLISDSVNTPTDEIVSGFGSSFFVNALDFAGGSYVVAGSDEVGTPKSQLAFFDASGTQGSSHSETGYLTVAAAREGAGAAILEVARPATPTPTNSFYVQHYDGSAAVAGAPILVGTSARKTSLWDLAWGPANASGLVCGSASAGSDEVLALFEQSASASTAKLTSEKLAALPATGDAAFGCQLALTDSGAAVALAESGGAPRLVWLDGQAQLVAGPVSFLSTYKSQRYFDVASRSGRTALAFFDDPGDGSRPTHVRVQVFLTPGGSPLTFVADDGMQLSDGTPWGDFMLGKVRVVPTDDGFAVAFDASPVAKVGYTDLVVRPLHCTP